KGDHEVSKSKIRIELDGLAEVFHRVRAVHVFQLDHCSIEQLAGFLGFGGNRHGTLPRRRTVTSAGQRENKAKQQHGSLTNLERFAWNGFHWFHRTTMAIFLASDGKTSRYQQSQ